MPEGKEKNIKEREAQSSKGTEEEEKEEVVETGRSHECNFTLCTKPFVYTAVTSSVEQIQLLNCVGVAVGCRFIDLPAAQIMLRFFCKFFWQHFLRRAN